MKTIFRILIILVVTAIVGGLMYVGVSAMGSATTFEDGDGRTQLPEGAEFRPEHEEHEGRDGRDGGFGFPTGIIKALVLMSVAGGVYSAIVWTGRKAKRSTTA